MIELRSPPTIESGHQGSWQLVLWAGTPFDYTTPFRSMLAEIARALGQNDQIDLDLPAYKDGEDFVTGTLRFGTGLLEVYYEHSLSYIALVSNTEDTIRDLADRIQSSIVVS